MNKETQLIYYSINAQGPQVRIPGDRLRILMGERVARLQAALSDTVNQLTNRCANRTAAEIAGLLVALKAPETLGSDALWLDVLATKADEYVKEVNTLTVLVRTLVSSAVYSMTPEDAIKYGVSL